MTPSDPKTQPCGLRRFIAAFVRRFISAITSHFAPADDLPKYGLPLGGSAEGGDDKTVTEKSVGVASEVEGRVE
jgi:hypothetical protein